MFEIIETTAFYKIKETKGQLIEDVSMIDSFPLRGSIYKLRNWITEDVMELEKMFDYDNPVNTWYMNKNGEILDICFKIIGKVIYKQLS